MNNYLLSENKSLKIITIYDLLGSIFHYALGYNMHNCIYWSQYWLSDVLEDLLRSKCNKKNVNLLFLTKTNRKYTI